MTPPYRSITIHQFRALKEAKANATEIIAYGFLVPDGAGLRTCSTDFIEDFTGEHGKPLSPQAVSRALSAMTRKEYYRPDGTTRPILEKMGAGFRGHTATYLDNLESDWGLSAKVNESDNQSKRIRLTNRDTKVNESDNPQYTNGAVTVKPSCPAPGLQKLKARKTNDDDEKAES
jgi:hypothetical protein